MRLRVGMMFTLVGYKLFYCGFVEGGKVVERVGEVGEEPTVR